MSRVNHIDKSIDPETLKKIDDYMAKCSEEEGVCYKSGKKYLLKKRVLNFLSGLFVATGIGTTAAVGPVGVPIVGGAIFCLAFAEKMEWGKHADHCFMLSKEFSVLIEYLVKCLRTKGTYDDAKFRASFEKIKELKGKACPKMLKTRDKWRKKRFPASYPNKG